MNFYTLLQSINADQSIGFIVVRTILLFVFAVLMLRVMNRRFNLNTTFDYLLVVILGSLLSRGMTGSAHLDITLITTFSLILLHRIFATGSFYSKSIGFILKGKPTLLIVNNQIDLKAMKKRHITLNDLQEELRIQLNSDDLFAVKEARLERTGRISFLLKK